MAWARLVESPWRCSAHPFHKDVVVSHKQKRTDVPQRAGGDLFASDRSAVFAIEPSTRIRLYRTNVDLVPPPKDSQRAGNLVMAGLRWLHADPSLLLRLLVGSERELHFECDGMNYALVWSYACGPNMRAQMRDGVIWITLPEGSVWIKTPLWKRLIQDR